MCFLLYLKLERLDLLDFRERVEKITRSSRSNFSRVNRCDYYSIIDVNISYKTVNYNERIICGKFYEKGIIKEEGFC